MSLLVDSTFLPKPKRFNSVLRTAVDEVVNGVLLFVEATMREVEGIDGANAADWAAKATVMAMETNFMIDEILVWFEYKGFLLVVVDDFWGVKIMITLSQPYNIRQDRSG